MPPEPTDITCRQLAAILDGGVAIVLLDVRRPEELDHCSIQVPPASLGVHVPMDEVPDRLAEIRSFEERVPVVVYCHHGVRSRMVTTWLIGQGLARVLNLEGGIDAWSLSVDPGVSRY